MAETLRSPEDDFVIDEEFMEEGDLPRRTDVPVSAGDFDQIKSITSSGIRLVGVLDDATGQEVVLRRGKGHAKAYNKEAHYGFDKEKLAAGAAERKEIAGAQIADVILKHLRADPAFLAAANKGISFRDGLTWSHKFKIPTAAFADVGGFEELVSICSKFGALNIGLSKGKVGDFSRSRGFGNILTGNPRMQWLCETLLPAFAQLEEEMFGQFQSPKEGIDWSKPDLGSGKGWRRELRADLHEAAEKDEIGVELDISVSDDRGVLGYVGAGTVGEISWKPESPASGAPKDAVAAE